MTDLFPVQPVSSATGVSQSNSQAADRTNESSQVVE